MLEKLTQHYEFTLTVGNGGHRVGFFSDIKEKISGSYEFCEGKFKLKEKNGNFFWWDYNPKK